MIAFDSSSLIAYLSGEQGEDVGQIEFALEQNQAVLPPVVTSELLSEPKLSKELIQLIQDLPQLKIFSGYWTRVGRLRAKLLEKKLRARLADALIAQSCIDHDIPLITRDEDFRHFAKLGGLKLF